MAIAFDAAAQSNNNNATSITFALTTSGSNRILFVGAGFNDAATDRDGGVTYNGVAATRIVRVASTNGDINHYYLINPASGANNVVVSRSTSGNIKAAAASYTGAKQSGVPDASGTHTVGSGTSIQKAITTILDNCWLSHVSYVLQGNAAATDSGSVRATAPSEVSIGDSNGNKTPAGSHQGGVSWSGSGDAGLSIVSFAPAPDTGHTKNILTLGAG